MACIAVYSIVGIRSEVVTDVTTWPSWRT